MGLDQPVCEAFLAIAELASAMKVKPSKLKGAWAVDINANLKVVVNAHQVPVQWDGLTIKPGNAYIEHYGWPAGFMNPFKGWLFGIQEDEFIAFINEKARTEAQARA